MDPLDYAMQISDRAYRQEIERWDRLSAKSNDLLKWIVVFVSVLNIGIPILSKRTDVDYHSCSFTPLATAATSLLLAKLPKKMKKYFVGKDVLKTFQKDFDDSKVLYENILLQDAVTNSMREINDTVARAITIAVVAVIVSIWMLIGLSLNMFLLL